MRRRSLSMPLGAYDALLATLRITHDQALDVTRYPSRSLVIVSPDACWYEGATRMDLWATVALLRIMAGR